ncbi:MAG: hypothetical protein RL215_2361, partial [Planctomycetota bacterium]
LLNSPWVKQRSVELQQRVAALPEAERIGTAWRLLFARQPDAEELEAGLSFIRTQMKAGSAEAVAWQDYLQALLSLNELHFTE